jgi:thymidylate synthase (FAD)
MTFNIKDHFRKIDVLDKGHVELMDGMITDPMLKVINSARVSFLKETTELTDRDRKLIKFLVDHEHFSTLRHSYFSFRVKAPLSVFRQWWKYQIGSEWVENENVGSIEIPDTSWNEASGRYVEFEPEFYIPEAIRIQSKDNKQGSHGKLEVRIPVEHLDNGLDPVSFFEHSCIRQYEDYKELVKAGAAKEQARMLLPQGIYSECIWTCSLQTIMFFLHQRLKEDAQWEIREYAKSIHELVKPLLVDGLIE